jgi:hypothetical protein
MISNDELFKIPFALFNGGTISIGFKQIAQDGSFFLQLGQKSI